MIGEIMLARLLACSFNRAKDTKPKRLNLTALHTGGPRRLLRKINTVVDLRGLPRQPGPFLLVTHWVVGDRSIACYSENR
jgi:hypothetical protein